MTPQVVLNKLGVVEFTEISKQELTYKIRISQIPFELVFIQGVRRMLTDFQE